MSEIEENYQKRWQMLMARQRSLDHEASGLVRTESVEDMEEAGKFWRSLRFKIKGYGIGSSRQEVLRSMGDVAIDKGDYALFEQGLMSALDLPSHFLPALAETLGNPAYFDEYFERFGHKLFPKEKE